MKALRVPTDALVPAKDFLAAQLAGSDPGVTVGLNLPAKWTTESRPAVVVESDGGIAAEWPVYTGDQVRVTVYAAGRTEARRIAGKCMGWLLAFRIPGIATVAPGAALLDARDENTDAFLAGFTVRVRTRTTSF